MRDHLICILRDARSVQIGTDCTRVKEFANNIETEAMAALHGGVTIIPSKLFGDIDIPQNVITEMSNGDSDLWFSVDKYIDVNLFYVPVTEADYRDRESQVALRGWGGSSSLNSNKTDNGFDEVDVSSDSDISSCERGGLEDPRPVSHQELRHKKELVADSVSSKSNPKSNYNRRKEAVLRKYFDTEALDIDDPGQRSDHELSEEDSVITF